ncbi:MAG: hypothetical protein RL338_1048 [Chloroflexota bacterium]
MAAPESIRLPFADRAAAGRLLGEALARRLGPATRDLVVLGIPRGGVVCAAEVAALLRVPLDVVAARKIGAPGHEELAIGAATADGTVILEPWAAETGADDAYLAGAAARTIAAAREREALLRRGRPRVPLAGRVAVIVDDGIATGATMHAAILAARAAGARRVVAAAPVGARESVERLAAVADEAVVLATPEPFYAVGDSYVRFDQTSDDEVVALLGAAFRAPAPGSDVANAPGIGVATATEPQPTDDPIGADVPDRRA